jgi:hypothetical protein
MEIGIYCFGSRYESPCPLRFIPEASFSKNCCVGTSGSEGPNAALFNAPCCPSLAAYKTIVGARKLVVCVLSHGSQYSLPPCPDERPKKGADPESYLEQEKTKGASLVPIVVFEGMVN